MYTVARLASVTATIHSGRAATSTAPTRVQSVPRVAKKRQATETAIPAVRRSALRRRFLPRPSGRVALSPGGRRDESAAGHLAPERPQTRAAGDRAEPEQRARHPLPLAVEPEPEPEHEEEKPERAPHTGRHEADRRSAAAAWRARSSAVHAERPASRTIAAARTACVARPVSWHVRCATRSESHAPQPRIR